MSSPSVGIWDRDMDGPLRETEARHRHHRRALILMGVGLIILMILLAPSQQRASNCGGNSTALSDVHLYCLIVQQGMDGGRVRRFRISEATPEQRENLARIADPPWIRPARFLVLPSLDRVLASGPRQVIIVCDTPFRNVPKPIWRRGMPRHAVGYSDGSVGLISVAEYQALDRSSLKPLDELLAETPAITAGLMAPSADPPEPK